MRYYEFILGTSSEEIKGKSKIRLKDYDFDSVIGAVNKYLHQNMKSSIRFLAYDDCEKGGIPAVFCYDESKHSFADAYEYVLSELESIFNITKVKEAPIEITSGRFYECFQEAKRRSACTHFGMSEMAKIRVHLDSCRDRDGNSNMFFELAEKIISEDAIVDNPMYDKSMSDELSNIATHINSTEFTGNMVHYVISGRSKEAIADMTNSLARSLYKANRISTKRMVVISDINKFFYKSDSYIREVIENNRGGVIAIDLSVKFGSDSTDYNLTSKYIEQLVQRYRNYCLFIFSYNMDDVGFSYDILRNLKKYVIPVVLREGSGNRKSAVKYMQLLIKASEYAKYKSQAGEFMKNYAGDVFSQTDVLMAFEQFGAWCVNKNILKAYNYGMSDDFILDRDENVASSQEKLDCMIGLNNVKEQIKTILATEIIEKERNNRSSKALKGRTMHMIFAGNPGTAKTTVARLFAGIAKENEIIKSGVFVEQTGTTLNGLPSDDGIRKFFEKAKGGILFIDEAYALTRDDIITALIQEMELRREEVIVILAGYDSRMQIFLQRNEGLKSRIPYWVNFSDYSADELTEIFKLMLEERGFSTTDDVISEVHYIFDKIRCTENFGNGRYVRNLLEHAIEKQSVRLFESKKDVSDIRKKDLFMLTKEDIATLDEEQDKVREPGTAMKELEDMIGLSSVKSVIKKALAGYRINKYCMEKGIPKDKASLHMVFTGNPGTAKTTVARLFAEIMKDEQILPTGKFVEVGRADLVGKYVGQTAPLVKNKFKEAQGGVLFIDEAYALCDSNKGGFGDEAINTIVQEMENHREETVVIFAGYPNEMQQFLDRNPGLSSRVAFRVEFDDYSTDELCDITRLMLEKKKISITDAAMNKLKAYYEVARESNDYGNGRFVRKLLEEAEMNLAQRLYELDKTEITTELLTTIEECDIPENSESKKNTKKNPIGFRVE